MKLSLLLFLLTLPAFFCASQDVSTIKVNTIESNNMELTQNRLKYQKFENGIALTKTAETIQARFNYNLLTNEILFIAPNGDTMALASPQSYTRIVIKEDSLYFSGHGFIEQLTHYPVYNLYRKQHLMFVSDEKKGGFGTYSTTASTHSISSYNDGRKIHQVAVDENHVYQFRETYYIGGRFQKIYPASKKGFADLFWKWEKEIKKFVEENNINYDKQQDLQKLLLYIQTLQ